MSRAGTVDRVLGHLQVGVRGVWRADPEVIAVFPTLSATVQAHRQEIRLRRGDSLAIKVQLQDDQDPPDPVAVDDALVRFAVKQGFGQTDSYRNFVGNEGCLILKSSTSPREIEVDSGAGRAVIFITSMETRDHPIVPFVWSLDVTRRTDPIPVTSLATVVAGTTVVMLNGSTGQLVAGDLVEIQGVLTRVTRVNGNHFFVEHDGWTTASQIAWAAWRSTSKVVASGPWVAEGSTLR